MTIADRDQRGKKRGPDDLGFDPDALRERYRQERERRLRADGNDQYVEVTGEFAHFVDDPYVEPGFAREPLAGEVDVALIGGGFGGLLAGARLRQLGIEDLRVIEKGGDFGGTWYWNRYPGLACDVESYVYLPLLEELDYVPKEKYSRGPEIFTHCKAIAAKYDLYRNACLQTKVTEVRWDESSSRWTISTNRGDAMRARFVCLANGFLQKPKLPGIPGIDTFKGHAFHTSRWDYAYTGGDSNGSLTGLRGKRVGIIGTGATAVQCVPHLGASAGHLYVFQRTPSSIDVRANRPTDPQWASRLEPGWQRRRMDNFQILTAGTTGRNRPAERLLLRRTDGVRRDPRKTARRRRTERPGVPIRLMGAAPSEFMDQRFQRTKITKAGHEGHEVFLLRVFRGESPTSRREGS